MFRRNLKIKLNVMVEEVVAKQNEIILNSIEDPCLMSKEEFCKESLILATRYKVLKEIEELL